ncbi:RelA/SpoT family protein [Crenothrix polyspora]|uniref:GTP pyrophosphokinase n=1 Tax=Crenothrix polyspora TaxID=360316 RepID=A0A1R4HHQ6_9GAMM|nr:bifunctional (p)ppGpp synthetase/guanosine-3',5'-bis(diphosphate) 3'-pyrophosphohydrolase [Crenothrix polyspora]SJM95739.1 GTP pyrophosphokinase [Crenothrix polyspora]
MKKSLAPKTVLTSQFSTADAQIIDQAVKIIDLIPEDLHYDRPQSIQVALFLLDFKVDLTTILATLLSDPRIVNMNPPINIAKHFGNKVATLVENVHSLNRSTIYSTDMAEQPNQTEILRRMLLSMTQDIRAVLIKLAYRTLRLRNLSKEPTETQLFIAQETLDIYAPITNRLGIHQLKWELEDLAFRYLNPQSYRSIAKSLANNRVHRELCINHFIDLLHSTLALESIPCHISGRPKHIYSIWRKMQLKKLSIDELFDLLAVRIIVSNLTECYTVLGVVHSLWQYIPKEFDDYIANPKNNGYQSLHTVILDMEGNRIEVQIRTQAMHDFAELGVAAHWSYKEGGKQNPALDKNITQLRKLLEENNNETLADSFNNELFNDRVYVLSPKGKLVDLVKGATPLDFAYAIHSDIGHRCRGAKVNGRIVPLTYKLKSGERVEVLTAKSGEPNHNWIDPHLGYLKSSRAISKVKSWFKNQQQSDNMATGKSILDKELQRLGLKSANLNELAKHFHQPDTDKLLEAIGRSDINHRQLAAFFKIPELQAAPLSLTKNKAASTSAKSLVAVDGIDNVLSSFALCCKPVQGNAIIGYISHHKGITIHRQDCDNIVHLAPEKQAQLIRVDWTLQKSNFTVPISINAFNGQNLLNHVTQVLSHAKIHIGSATLNTHADFSATLELTIQVGNINQLSQVLSKIAQLPHIIDVKRKI